MKKFFSEFKKFISRGNVMDMAVGTIIGAAFTAIVTALTNGILKPFINFIIFKCIPGEGLDSMFTFLVKKTKVDDAGATVIDLANSIYIDWGAFISAIINFLLIAIVLFCIIKAFNSVKDATEGAKDLDKRIEFKQEKGLKLNKKETKYLEAKERALAKAKAEEEAKALEPKIPTTDELLIQIRDLLANK